MSWGSRIIGHGEEAPDQLLANPMNWRIHPQAQSDAMERVLERVGWVQSVIVNRTTGNLIDGHLRVGLAIARDEPSVPVAYVELTEEEERLVLLSLDPLAGLAVPDKELLRQLMGEVEDLEALFGEGLAVSLTDLAREWKGDWDDVQEPDGGDGDGGITSLIRIRVPHPLHAAVLAAVKEACSGFEGIEIEVPHA